MVKKLCGHILAKVSAVAGILMMTWFMMTGLFISQPPHISASETVPAKISEKAWLAAQDGHRVDVIVLLGHQADLTGVTRLTGRQAKNAYVFNTLFSTAETNQVAIRDWLAMRGVTYRSFYIVNALELEADGDLLAALAKRDDVKRVLTNPQIALSVLATPQAPENIRLQSVDGIEWGVQQIQAPQVWSLGFRGEGVIVAGQDTGYDWDHPALKQSYRGWDGVTLTHDYYWHDAIHSSSGTCGADSPVPCDDYGHGTHTMGTIVGETETDHIGVAPGARWIGCRNMSVGVGTPASYAECFEFFMAPYPVAGTPDQGNPAMAPDIINNSWSCPPYEGCDPDHIAFLSQVVSNVRAAGIMVVASASNQGPACGTVDEPPAMFEATYAVGATNLFDAIADFSSRGISPGLRKPNIVAPGVNVRSCVPGIGYGYSSGTSMASPHIVGAVSLLWSANPDLRGQINTTENIVNHTAVPLYSTQCGDAQLTVPNSVYGWGRVDAFAAVHAVISGTLSGIIQQQTGEGIMGVTINAELKPGVEWETISGILGQYHIEPVSGTYTVTFSEPTYVTQVHTDVVVTTAQATMLPITLTQKCIPLEGLGFVSTPQFPQADRPALFSSNVMTGSAPITWTWNFDDGTPMAFGNPVSHTFTFPVSEFAHTYQVELTATNACGSDFIQQWVSAHGIFSFLPIVLRGP